jgi:ribonuclease HII
MEEIDNRKYEKELNKRGINVIAGIDEVGRGPLVGPVVSACVVLPKDYFLEGLTDSKKLSKKKREFFYDIIMKDALSVGIGVVDNNVIDDINIYEATKVAMKEAFDKANKKIKIEHVLIDAMKLDLGVDTTSIIKGDLKSITISAASVIAKVYRDRLLEELDKKYPMYGFKDNAGYGTKKHIEAIEEYGIIKEHRKTFKPVCFHLDHINKEVNN